MSLEIKTLSKSFGQKKIFDNFSYTFQSTGLYLLSGESGKGKTTLLRIIAGLDTKFKGKVIGGGVKNISYLFQEYRLFPNLSVLENAAVSVPENISAQEASEKAKKMLSDLGLSTEDMSLMPNEISGGMKQRVAFARALLKPSSILLLDEPTKELDEDLRKIMLKMIKEDSENRLVILVTHLDENIENLYADIIKI